MSVVDTRDECREVAAALRREGLLELGERWEARAVALDGAPPGAGWEWLAARGDEGARAAIGVDCEVSR